MQDKEHEPDFEIEGSEPELETPDSVSQVVPDDLEIKKPVEKPDDKPKLETPKPSQDLSKLHNTIAYQTRQLEKAMKELAEMRSQIASRQQTVQSQPQTQDEIDAIAEKDWKLGVKKVVEKDIEAKVQEILAKREEALQEVQKRTAAEQELEKSKQRVLQKYPSIEESGSEEARLYREVLNEDSSLLSNIHGPEIAMYRMEEKLRQSGVVPQSVRPVLDREVSRLARAGMSSVIGRTNATRKTSELTKEQKEFCKHHGISEDAYKANLKSQDSRGGVEA